MPTVGEMIRKRRLDLGLRQIDAAKMIGCEEMSVVNWEKGRHSPTRQSPRQSFNPFQDGDTLAHRFVSRRKELGITQRNFAVELGIDPSTLARWERGERKPKGRVATKIEDLTKIRPA